MAEEEFPEKSQLESPQARDAARSDESDSAGVTDVAEMSPFDARVAELLTKSIDVEALADAVERQEAPDAADTLESLEEEDAVDVLGEMDDELAADALAEMNIPLAVSILDDVIDDDPRYAAQLLEMMAPDDAADVLQALDRERREKALRFMDARLARRLQQLVNYDHESAGGIMTIDFPTLRELMTVQDSVSHLRASPVSENTHSVLVTDEDSRLVGIVPLRKLLIARQADRIGQIMDRDLRTVPATMDREHVAREIDRYDCDMVPVVDSEGRPLGIVTVDDVIDIIRAEQTEDVQRAVGAGAHEAVYSSLGTKVRSRFPWLLINLFTSTVAAVVVLMFSDLFEELAILAALMPVIANQAGNAGQQSLAVTLRGIVLHEVRPERVWPLLAREASVGLINGIIGGLLVGIGLALFGEFVTGASWRIGVVAAIAMMASLSIGCFVGSSMPILIRRVGLDPATGSTIFLTMTTDTVSFLTFLGTASMLQQWLLAGA